MDKNLDDIMKSELEKLLPRNMTPEEKKEAIRALETRIEQEQRKYITISEVLKHPLKYSSGGLKEMGTDLRVIDISKMTKRQKIACKIAMPLGGILSFGMWAMPHELIHAGINKLTGGTNEEIVLNRIYGADIIHAIIPQVQSKLMTPFCGGYVQINPASDLGNLATTIAPYALTPLGVYLIQKAEEKQNKKYGIAGAGLIYAHAGGLIGDFYSLGRKTIQITCKTILHKDPLGPTKANVPTHYETLLLGTTVIAGFLIGNRIMSYTYRLSKGLVNSVRNYCNNKKSFA